MCLYIGAHKNINFPFGTNEKNGLGAPILKHIRVVFKLIMTSVPVIFVLNKLYLLSGCLSLILLVMSRPKLLDH